MIRKMTKQEQVEHMIKIFSTLSKEDLQATKDALAIVERATALREAKVKTTQSFMVLDMSKMKIMQ